MKTKTSRIIAFARDDFFDDYLVTVTETYLGDGWTEHAGEWGQTFHKYRYTVTTTDIEQYSEWSGEIESHSYRNVVTALAKFKELITAKKNGLGEPTIKKVYLCDGFIDDYDEDLDPYYYRRSERLDYAGHPWDAPGMTVSDFISGVQYC